MTSLPLQLWPGASREMYLCYSALFSSMQAQHGNGGRGRESVHVRSSAGTSPSGPLLCRGLLRKVSEKGPLEDQGCHSKSPYQLEVLRRRGVHWSKVLTSFSRVKNVYSCAHPDKVFRPLFSPPFIIFFLITSLISSLPYNIQQAGTLRLIYSTLLYLLFQSKMDKVN